MDQRLRGRVLSWVAPALPGPRRRVIPSGTVSVIFGFGSEQRMVDPREPSRILFRATSFVAGLHDGPAVAEHRPGTRMFRLDVTPSFAFTLFGGAPMHELANGFVDLAEVLPGSAELCGRLADTSDDGVQLRLIAEALLARLGTGPAPSPAVLHAHELLLRTGGRVPIAALAEAVGWSRRQLTRRFHRELGLAPKQLARVLRLHRAVPLLRGGATPATAAVRTGYSDQAHLARECRSLTGCTPTQLLTEFTTGRTAVP